MQPRFRHAIRLVLPKKYPTSAHIELESRLRTGLKYLCDALNSIQKSVRITAGVELYLDAPYTDDTLGIALGIESLNIKNGVYMAKSKKKATKKKGC